MPGSRLPSTAAGEAGGERSYRRGGDQRFDARYGDLQTHAEDQERKYPVYDLFAVRPEELDDPSGVEVKDIDQDADTDHGQQHRARIDEIIPDAGVSAVHA